MDHLSYKNLSYIDYWLLGLGRTTCCTLCFLFSKWFQDWVRVISILYRRIEIQLGIRKYGCRDRHESSLGKASHLTFHIEVVPPSFSDLIRKSKFLKKDARCPYRVEAGAQREVIVLTVSGYILDSLLTSWKRFLVWFLYYGCLFLSEMCHLLDSLAKGWIRKGKKPD